MARIQILQLPSSDPDGEERFALVVDESQMPPQRMVAGLVGDADPSSFTTTADRLIPMPPVELTDPWREFATEIGAAGLIVTPERVDIVQPAGQAETHHFHFQQQTLSAKDVERILRRRGDGGAAVGANG